MTIDKLEIEIKAGLNVSDETINRCLKLIQWWLNDNPDKRIVGGLRHENGDIEELRIEKKKSKSPEGGLE